MSEYKTIRVKPMDFNSYLDYLKENQCINCPMYRGKGHDYKCEWCSKCMNHFTNFKYIDTGKELNEKYISKMKALKDESDHDEADWLLCDLLEELGYTELVEVYKKLPKWYS